MVAPIVAEDTIPCVRWPASGMKAGVIACGIVPHLGGFAIGLPLRAHPPKRADESFAPTISCPPRQEVEC
jgi:hypothetical protein